MSADRQVLQVSELIELVNGVLADFRDLYVEGEVTNFTRSGQGHLYFTIKDARAQVSVVMFAMYARSLKFKLENGLKIIVRGRLKIYEARGGFQIVADSLEPVGLGALQLAFEQLKAKLAGEGLFDADRKKPIPMLPQKIAVVTSPTGAAIRDVLKVFSRRFENLSIQIYPVRVQGNTAATEIAKAVRNLSRWNEHDLVIICRGGGSLEDLWPFNEEAVARAVAACRIPTISGVGHEVDFTICDFVADLRAPTPSAAAEIAIRAKADLCEQIDNGVRRLRHVILTRVRNYRSELRHLSSSDGLGAFTQTVARNRERLKRRQMVLHRLLEAQARSLRKRLAHDDQILFEMPARLGIVQRLRYLRLTEQRARRALDVQLEARRERLVAAVAKLQAVSPLSVLARGYSIAFSMKNGRLRPLYDTAQVNVGEPVTVQLKRGRMECTVDRKTIGIETVWPDSPAEANEIKQRMANDGTPAGK